jgi:hypothetical protein
MSSHSTLHKIGTGLRILYRHHGPLFPLILAHRSLLYCSRKMLGPQTFEFAGRTHRYFFHPYSLNNERAVEVALARAFLEGVSGDVLEIGNVLTNYFAFAHDVVDKYEIAPGVINQDVVTYAPGKQYDRIVTISTMEHVGWDEQPKEPAKVELAIQRLKQLLKKDGRLLVTVPFGYNTHLDELVRQGRTGLSDVRYLIRVSANNRWREATAEEATRAQYGSPFPCANAVVVGTFSNG